VARALQAARAASSGESAEQLQEAEDIHGRRVLTAYAPVAPLRWLVFAELPRAEAYGETPAKMRGVLDRIQRNRKHLLGLINDVLDLSKIEAGQLTLALAEYSVKDVVHNVFSAR
jgi:signal transduction histidine kinase